MLQIGWRKTFVAFLFAIGCLGRCVSVCACVSVDMCDVEERQGDGRIINF